MIVITICATSRYAYAMTAQARRVAACIKSDMPAGKVVVVGDNSEKIKNVIKLYGELLPSGWFVEHIVLNGLNDSHKNYKESAQLVIGQLRTAAFARARKLGAQYCWSLDSDVLPPENALHCMLATQSFDNGYYSISTCPYPSQGGGGYLGGRGTVYQPILPDIFEEERNIPDELKKEIDDCRQILLNSKPTTEEEFKNIEQVRAKLTKLDEKVKECPPKGNIFQLNGIQWRKRGWFDNAYPAIGKGSIVPSDWCGFGCTLMNRRALDLAHFDGYDGAGTEDLYIVWCRWYQAGLRINCIAHCPADHVIRNPGKPGYYLLQQACHETEGECIGHLRVKTRPFYSFDPGEAYDKENDGKFVAPPKEEEKKEEIATKAVEEILEKETKKKK